MLGTSPVYATDFTDDTFSAEESLSASTDSTDIFAGQAAPDGESPLSQASDSTSALEAATDDFQEASQTDETAFMSDEDVFSSLDQTSEFGSDVEEQDEECLQTLIKVWLHSHYTYRMNKVSELMNQDILTYIFILRQCQQILFSATG